VIDFDAAEVAQDARHAWRVARIRRVGRWSLVAIAVTTLTHVGFLLWAAAALDGWAYWPLVAASVVVRCVVDRAWVRVRDRQWSTDHMNARWAELYPEAAQLLAPLDAMVELCGMVEVMDSIEREVRDATE
jgi:hypothetical protein